VQLVDLDITLDAPFDPRYNDLNDPATINLTETICNGVSNASAPLTKKAGASTAIYLDASTSPGKQKYKFFWIIFEIFKYSYSNVQ